MSEGPSKLAVAITPRDRRRPSPSGELERPRPVQPDGSFATCTECVPEGEDREGIHSFKRCTVCDRVVKGKRTNCKATSVSWGFIVDIGKDGDGKRRQRRRTALHECGLTSARRQHQMDLAGLDRDPLAKGVIALSGPRGSTNRTPPRGSTANLCYRPLPELAAGTSNPSRAAVPWGCLSHEGVRVSVGLVGELDPQWQVVGDAPGHLLAGDVAVDQADEVEAAGLAGGSQ